jgi:type VI secretion system protein ImpJ
LTFATGAPGDIEQLVKLWALNELESRFSVVANTPQLHPFALYRLLCESIGKVALWDDTRRSRELPVYEHSDAGPIFAELFRYLRTLVNGMLPSDFVERPFEQVQGGFSVTLDYEWFTPNHEMYLGIRSTMQLEEIEALFKAINFKLASPKDAPQVFDRRLPGLEFRPAGTVPNLPKSSDIHYFRVSRTPLYWPHCEQERGIFIRMPPQDIPRLEGIKMALFVVKVK